MLRKNELGEEKDLYADDEGGNASRSKHESPVKSSDPTSVGHIVKSQVRYESHTIGQSQS